MITSAVSSFSGELDHTVFNGKILAIIGTSILAQQEDKLWMVDSLRAAKSISYQLLCEPLTKKKTVANNNLIVQNKSAENFLLSDIRSQKLLIPENISLTQNDCDILLKWQQQLVLLGVEFTFSGPENVMLRVIPKLPFVMNNNLMISNMSHCLQTLKLTNKETKFNQQNIQLLLKTISNSLDPLQTFDKPQQQIILNYVSQSKYYPDQFTESYKQSYQILNDEDMKKIIGSK